MRAEEGQLHLNGIMGPSSEKDELHEDIESTRRQLAEEDLLSPRRKKHILNDPGSDWKLLLEDTTEVGKRYAKLCRKTAQEMLVFQFLYNCSVSIASPALSLDSHSSWELPECTN
jgi:hypothetical protein